MANGFVLTAQSYSVLPTDEQINVIPSIGISILLPIISSVPVGKSFVIKDAGGTAATYNITVGLTGATTLDGSSTQSIVQNYGVMTLVSAGNVWYVTNDPVNVGGPASATDNTVVRFDGTTGKAVQASNVVVSDLDELYGEKWLVSAANTNVTTGYTLTSSDSGKLIEMNLSVSRALTLPNDLATGFFCDVVQAGLAAGKVVFTPASGATLTGNSAVTTTAGVWARCSLYVHSNASGTSAVYVLSGNVG